MAPGLTRSWGFCAAGSERLLRRALRGVSGLRQAVCGTSPGGGAVNGWCSGCTMICTICAAKASGRTFTTPASSREQSSKVVCISAAAPDAAWSWRSTDLINRVGNMGLALYLDARVRVLPFRNHRVAIARPAPGWRCTPCRVAMGRAMAATGRRPPKSVMAAPTPSHWCSAWPPSTGFRPPCMHPVRATSGRWLSSVGCPGYRAHRRGLGRCRTPVGGAAWGDGAS